MKNIRAYWWRAVNFGDTLTPIILEHFLGLPVEFSPKPHAGRVVGVGSIAHHAGPGDIIFGSGSNRPHKKIDAKDLTILALRGPLTRQQMTGNDNIPEIYGDPAILLPLMYSPEIKKKYKVGILPHYVDKPLIDSNVGNAIARGKGWKMLDIQKDWKELINDMLECEEIVSSSLHGIIAAEAYGIPAEWAVWGEKIIGGEYKFRDYLLGTGRPEQGPGKFPPIPDLKGRQEALINAMKKIKCQ